MKETRGTTEEVAGGQKVFFRSFAEITLAEAFLRSKTVNPFATDPPTC